MKRNKSFANADIRTKISTIIALLAYCNFLFASFDTSVLEPYPALQKVYQVCSAIFAGAAWLNSHYFNQNFTPEGIMGTIHTRELKRENDEALLALIHNEEFDNKSDDALEE